MDIINVLQLLNFNDHILSLKIKTEPYNRRNLFFLEWDEMNKVVIFLENNNFLFINSDEIEKITMFQY
ncbi:hypothetical protein COF09_30545 [Bacillus toyonensis]|uniref:hypothetical protein n=1 Tax=Bacillus toyonensis TaxID=155322 RepID=UPI000BFB30C0|nr:hypothetical protein [Bacillus toyonensis]PHC35896.1 hypothetical protein COF09_30545 [Bacillus toyonensis]